MTCDMCDFSIEQSIYVTARKTAILIKRNSNFRNDVSFSKNYTHMKMIQKYAIYEGRWISVI